MTEQWRYVHSHSHIKRDNVTPSDKTVEIRQFFLTYLHFQTNEYIFEGMNGTIVFLVDGCLVIKNQCSLWTLIRIQNHYFSFSPLFLISILGICQFNFVWQTGSHPIGKSHKVNKLRMQNRTLIVASTLKGFQMAVGGYVPIWVEKRTASCVLYSLTI